MTRRFDITTIIGVGLLGGSLGQAMKARGMASTIRGVGHRQVSLDKAREVGAVDETCLDAVESVRGADLVVVCTPAALVIPTLESIRTACSPNTLVTDVASTKASICGYARDAWRGAPWFVGSHPMAGSEKFGPEHAMPDLYNGCVTLVESGEHIDAAAHQAICDLWRGVGARVIDVDPFEHDAMVARTSHIPHVIAAVVATLAGRKKNVQPFVGPGFRDVTRIAASRPAIWRDICLTNREAILQGLEELEQDLDGLRAALNEQDAAAVEAFFARGQAARQETVGP